MEKDEFPDSPIKILYAASAWAGGPTRSTLNAVLGLCADRGLELHLAASKANRIHLAKNYTFLDASVVDRLKTNGVRIHLLPISLGNAYADWLVVIVYAFFIIVRERIRIVHVHHLIDSLFLSLLAKGVGRKVVFGIEGVPGLSTPAYGADPRSPQSRLVVPASFRPLLTAVSSGATLLALKLCDAVVTCSSWVASRINSSLQHKVTPLIVPVDWETFSSADGSKVKDEIGVTGKMVFTAARLVPVKGLEDLVRAAAIVISRVPNTTFVIAGTGSLKSKLENIAHGLGIDGKLLLVGHWRLVERLTAACDVAILPSKYEPMGMPAAEAGACRKPVVVTDAGGLPEVVENGVTGFVVPKDDVNMMAEALITLLCDEDKARAMGEAGYERVKKLFSPESVARRVAAVYRSIA